ncbi:MAG: tetratricopeptide repeat protein, partial [Myxococcaceae bacterium]
EAAEITRVHLEQAQTEDARTAAALRLARLYAELGRGEDAVRLLLPRLSAGGEPIAEELQRLAAQGLQEAEIRSALTPHLARSGDRQREAAALFVELAGATQADHKKKALVRLAELNAEALNDPKAAFGFLLRAVALTPDDTALVDKAWEVASRSGSLLELARALAEAATAVQDSPQLKASLFDRSSAAALAASSLEDAARWAEQALAVAETPPLMDRLVELTFELGRPEESARWLRRRLLLTKSDPEKCSLYLRLAELEELLGRFTEATTALEEAVRHGPAEAPLLPRFTALLSPTQSTNAPAVPLSMEASPAASSAPSVTPAAQPSVPSAGAATAVGPVAPEGGGLVETALRTLKKQPQEAASLATLELWIADPKVGVAAARGLAAALSEADPPRALAAFEVLAERAETVQERVRALKEISRLQLSLKQAELALAALARAVRLAPNDSQLLREAEQLAESSDCLEVLVEVLEELEPSAAIHITLARALEKLGAARAAVLGHLHAARAEAPQNVEVLRALVLQHRAHDEWAALAKVLEALPAALSKPKEKLSALREVALVYENRLLDKGSAASAWRQVAEYDPADADAVLALDRLYTELDRPQDLLFALELGRNQAAGTSRGRELSVKLALLKANRLGELSVAVTLCREVLVEDAGSASAREALESFVGRREGAGGSALAVLDPLLAQAGDHARRAALRETRLAATADASEQARLTAELRGLYETQLQQPERAFMAAVKSFSAGQGDRGELIEDLTRLAASTGMHEELAEIFEAALETLPPGDPHQTLLLRRAAFAREALSDLDGATRLWNALMGVAPTDMEGLRHLSQLYEKEQNAKNLSEVYARQAALAEDPEERRRLLLAAAAAYEDSGADEAAVEALRSALVLKRSTDVLFALERLYGKLKRGDEQAESLSALVGLAASADEAFSLRVRLGQVLERAEKDEAAAEAFHAAIQDAPENARATQPYASAVASLQRLFESGRTTAGLDVLESAHRARGDRRALAEVLEKRVESGGTLEQFGELAALRESLGERLAAFAARLRAFSLTPTDEVNRQELERLADELDSRDELAAVYEDRLERGADSTLQRTLWRRLAQLQEGLGRTEQAGRAWEELARRSPAELEPLQALSRIYTKGMAFRELSDVLIRQVELETETPRKVDLLVSAANVAEVSLRDTALALRCYRTVLALSPGELSARHSLERLLTAESDHAGLAAYYEEELALEGDATSPRALELKVTVARLKATRLGQPNDALALLQQVLAEEPDQSNALKTLQELLATPEIGKAAGDVVEQLLAQSAPGTPRRTELMESQIRAEQDRSRRATLLRRLSEEQSARPDGRELAFLSAARALREAPEDAASVELCLRTAEAADSVDALDELLEELGPTAPTPEARLFLARTWARLRERSGSNAEAAWRAVLLQAPEDAEAQAALEKALRTPRRAPELVKLLRERLAQTPGGESELLPKIAVAQELAGDVNGAVLSLQQAFAHAPSSAPLQQLEQLLARTSGRGRERAEVLSRLASLSNEPEGSFAFLLSRAQLLESLGELDAAVMAYGEVLSSPAHAETAVAALERQVSHESGGLRAAHLLEPVLRARGDQKRLVTVLEARVPAADKPTRRALLEEIASLREQVGQSSLAFAARARAVLESPADEAARAELERVAAASGLLEELVDTYEDLLERNPPDALRLALRRRLAELFSGPVPRPAEALAAWEDVSQHVPEDIGALAALADAYRKSASHPQLVAVLYRQIDVEPNVDRQVERLFELAELAEGSLGRDDLAIDAYQQILERHPTERGALRALQSAFDRTRRYGELADAISREIALLRSADDVDAALERQVVLGNLHAERLNDPHTALATYSSVLSARPQHEAGLAALEGMVLNGSLVAVDAARQIEPLLDQQGAHKRLVGVLEAHVRAEPRPAERAALLRWIAGLQGSALRNPPAAFLAAARALREAPSDSAALEL